MAGKLVGNERRKLTAAYLNGVAIALMAVGVVAPIASLVTSSSSSLPTAGILAIGCILMSTGLHYLARQFLNGLEE